jgi:cysteinyl-tRNA synthetase
LLSTHYRTPIAFSVDGVAEFRRALDRVWRLWEDVEDAMPARIVPDGDDGRLLVEFPERLASVLDEDFNTARAWAVVFEMTRAAYTLMQQGGMVGEAAAGLARRNLEVADRVLQILPLRREVAGETLPAEIARLVAERETARRDRDWARADALRAAVQARGWQIQDTPDGPVVRPQNRRAE